jgi:4-hydroxy-tetrahydrodipicolinate synthase
MFKGSMVALVTPFKKTERGRTGLIDEKTLKDMIEFHIESGTAALVPCGTTGESATLSYEEHDKMIELTIKYAAGRVPVIAGTGSNCTEEAIEITKHAKKSGADASLQVNPYYNKPTQEGLYRHFRAIADEVDIPIILYNIASRTGINMQPETVARLARDCDNIVGIKEASGSLEQMARIKQLCGEDFDLISGDDSLTLPLLSVGGSGVISVVGNIVPKDVADLVGAFEKGDIKRARDLHFKLMPLVKAMFIETNPIPVKTAMGMMGLCKPDLLLPMCEMSAENKKKLEKALKDYGLI